MPFFCYRNSRKMESLNRNARGKCSDKRQDLVLLVRKLTPGTRPSLSNDFYYLLFICFPTVKWKLHFFVTIIAKATSVDSFLFATILNYSYQEEISIYPPYTDKILATASYISQT